MASAREARSPNAARLSMWAVLPLALFACAAPRDAPHAPQIAAGAPEQRVNLRHFDHLYAEAIVGGERVGVLNIYSEAPDYRFAIEPNEGYACVDDVARGIVLLAAEPRLEPARLHQLDMMTRFVLRMQANNGYFHNFIWGDGRINREYRTSLAELNWWSLRALWGLEAALLRLPPGSETARRARAAADRLVANLKRDLPQGEALTQVEGVTVPTWLPFGSGADAGAAAMLGLVPHVRRTGDAHARALVGRLGDGLMRMQVGDAGHFPHHAHLSWRNTWHGWGNAQAYALLRAGELLERRDLTAGALKAIDGFYPILLDGGMIASFSMQGEKAVEIARYPQIAYGISPMVLAAMEAHRITGEPRYREMARRLAGWFSGANDAGRAMYDPATGRVYDGITGRGAINANAGAESTVEGLLALRALDGRPLP